MKFDWLYWCAGRLWGERLIGILSGRRNRGGKYMDRVQRWGWKFTWPAVIVAPFLPIPTAIIYVVAGWAGMRLVTFLILDAIGSLLWAGLLAGLGWELGHHAVVVAQTISHYGLWISLGLVVVIVFFQVRSQRHMMRAAAQARAAAAGGQASTAAQPSRGDEAGGRTRAGPGRPPTSRPVPGPAGQPGASRCQRDAPGTGLCVCYPFVVWMPEIVPCAVCRAEFTDAVPVIAAWMAVQIACDTFG
jgi:hypothetical protein